MRTSIARQRLTGPLYAELPQTLAGADRAGNVHLRARPNYHPDAIAAAGRLLMRKAGP
jgi:hypothetical protein